MIDVSHLSYDYGTVRAVDDISFHIPKGEIVALVGPNGAGKSTTMKILTTLLRPSAGNVRIAGYDVTQEPQEVRRRLGYLPENNPLYGDMLVFDALTSIARQRLLPRHQCADVVQRVAESCALLPVMHRYIGELSRGYRQRVGFAQAILHDPEVLILDEATTGLDPNQIRDIRDLILSIGQHRTILISTHILQEVHALASRLILIHQGKIACDGNINTLCQAIAPKIKKTTPTLEDLFAFYTLPNTTSPLGE